MLDRASRWPKVWMSVWISVSLGLLIGLIAPVASAAPCIAVDCSAFDTECSTASCDPIPPEDNCDTLTFLPPSTVCNPGSGDLCDPDETCTGSSPDCPADVFEPATAICNEGSSSVAVTLAGFSVNGIASLSTDPISGLLYGILKTAGGSSGRRLVTIDTITGVATDIGPLPDGFANIEFGAAGLFGVTGDGAPADPESLFSVSTADASTALIQALGNGTDGESIALNPVSGLMYHWSGVDLGLIMETIDLGDQTLSAVPTDVSTYDPREVFGSTYDPGSGSFLFTDLKGNLGSVSFGGVFSLMGALPTSLRGLAFRGGILYAGEKSGSTLHALNPSTGERSSDVCDPDELCPGKADQACPSDFFELATTVCSAGSGDLCDLDELCPGTADQSCPLNVFEPATTICHAGSGDLCDPDEFCPGTANQSCPFDFFQPPGTVCNPGASLVTVTLAGFSVNGIVSLSADPGSGLLYGILKTGAGPSGRRLATIDPATGVATDIGPLPDGFANIEFGGGGLFGVTGDGAPVNPESFFSVSTADASTAFIQLLGNGNDGESIAFNPVDGLMYHWSGFASVVTQIMETINLSNQAVTNVPLDFSFYNPQEVFGSTYDPASGDFFFSDNNGELGSVTPGGVFSLIGPLPASIRGLAFDGGVLYGSEKSGSTLFTLDASTGARASDPCDPDELCTGVADQACPVDFFEPGTTVCNVGSGDLCDPDELCPGVADLPCPPGDTQLAAASTVCNPGSGDICDPDEVCNGVEELACPADVFDPGTAVCNLGSGDLCDPDELCPGVADLACPADFFEPVTTICNAGSGDLCDPDELCPGVADATCPPDFVEDDGTACPDGHVCNGDEACASGSCAPATPLDCDDLDPCTADSCDEVSGCAHAPIPMCGVAVPTTSIWGRVVLALFLLAVGTIGKRRVQSWPPSVH